MIKVLIIDDEKNIQVSLSSVLKDEGFSVFLASTGEEGIEKMQHIRPDIILLDIWLPGIDGLETMSRILQIDPMQTIIMISGHGNINAAVRALRQGAYDYLEKPLSLEKVLIVLNRALSYRNVLAENQRLRAMVEQQMETGDSNGARKRENTGQIEYFTTNPLYVRKQATIGKSAILKGIGLHTGEKTGMVLNPLPPNKGIRFENISEPGYIPARVEYLDSTSYATSIKKDRLEAKTIEHIMATLHAAGITNLAIKISREVPVADGSAAKFCEFIRECGVVPQEEIIPEIVIEEPIQLGKESENGKFMRLEPSDVFSVSYTTIYPEPLGRSTYDFVMKSFEDFEREIAPARTYGFVEEISRLTELGLGEGGRLHNFIWIDNDLKVINTELRFPEELARHKILDIIGDFYLLGRPIRGRIVAQKTGHADNAQMVNLVKERYG